MSAPVLDPAAPAAGFRRRLLDGLAASIAERGYRETTVADIVRAARTSKRTFYDHFASKEECFVELLTANNADLVDEVRAAADPKAPWAEQVRAAVRAYVRFIEAQPAIAQAWIRELPALGESARPMLRLGFTRLTEMIVALTGTPAFRRAGLEPLSASAAVILVGGLRELTAQTVENGEPVSAMVEPVVGVVLALLGRP